MQITKLEYQKKDKNFVNVYIDDQFAVSLDANDILRLGLAKGIEIDKDLLTKITETSEFGKMFNAALNFLSYRPRSEWEVRKKLKFFIIKNKITDLLVMDRVIEKLKKIDQLDDTEFIRWYVDQRRTFRIKGNRAIEYELKKKGVDTKLISLTMSEEDGSDVHSEYKLAYQALLKKFKNENFVKADRRQILRIQRFLLSRGFEWETVKSLVEKVVKKGYNDAS